MNQGSAAPTVQSAGAAAPKSLDEIWQHATDCLCKYDWPQAMFEHIGTTIRSACELAYEKGHDDGYWSATPNAKPKNFVPSKTQKENK
jgi:hypothetical protein